MQAVSPPFREGSGVGQRSPNSRTASSVDVDGRAFQDCIAGALKLQPALRADACIGRGTDLHRLRVELDRPLLRLKHDILVGRDGDRVRGGIEGEAVLAALIYDLDLLF